MTSKPPKENVHFMSKKQDWKTPRSLFEALNMEHRFTLDVCASKDNALCEHYFTIEDDALRKNWSPNRCFMNPPYGRQIGAFVQKAFEESLKGGLICCLLPCRPDTAWWNDYVRRASEIRYLRGRLKFGDAQNSAPFPSAIVIFRPPPCHLTSDLQSIAKK